MKKYLFNILVSLSQVANVLLAGDPDETLSSRAGKKHPRLAKIIDRLMWFDPDHCATSVEPDEGGNTPAKKDLRNFGLILIGASLIWLLFAL